MIFKRKVEERKVEEEKAKKIFNSKDLQPVAKKLGLRTDAPREKIIFELNRLKNPTTRKKVGITEQDLKDYGII